MYMFSELMLLQVCKELILWAEMWENENCCRQHKAKAESAKLTVIKQELDRLDQMINSDVSVIRNKIEVASREFLEAQYVVLSVTEVCVGRAPAVWIRSGRAQK